MQVKDILSKIRATRGTFKGIDAATIKAFKDRYAYLVANKERKITNVGAIRFKAAEANHNSKVNFPFSYKVGLIDAIETQLV